MSLNSHCQSILEFIKNNFILAEIVEIFEILSRNQTENANSERENIGESRVVFRTQDSVFVAVQKFRTVSRFIAVVGQSVFISVLVRGIEQRGEHLDHLVIPKINIFRLEVSVIDSVSIHVFQISNQILDDDSHFFLGNIRSLRRNLLDV